MRAIIIAIDGACKRNGKPNCTSAGAAWIGTEAGEYLFRSKFELESTSQRGEINGLIEALKYAADYSYSEEVIVIITDSEYLLNTVGLGWCYKWRENGWKNADGNDTKNADLWSIVCMLLDKINHTEERVYIEWIKGHCIHYTPGNIRRAMLEDDTGLELYSKIITKAHMPADIDNIINKVIGERREHGKMVLPRETALEWAIANTMADCLAYYIANEFDKLYLKAQEQNLDLDAEAFEYKTKN